MEFSIWSTIELVHPELLDGQTVYICTHTDMSKALLKESLATCLPCDSDGALADAFSPIDEKKVVRECQPNKKEHIMFYTKKGAFCTAKPSVICKAYSDSDHRLMLSPFVHPKNVFDKVEFGKYHTVIVNKMGQVICFGPCMKSRFHSKPLAKIIKNNTQVDVLEGVKVVDVACGNGFSILLDQNEKVYLWGASNNSVGLGICTFDSKLLPVLIPINDNIVKVVCGVLHVLALSSKGDLYTWGSNFNGELAYNNHTDNFSKKPNKLMSRVSEILAMRNSEMCAAKKGSRVYVWGRVNGHVFDNPALTVYSDITAPFLLLSSRALTPKLVVLKNPVAFTMKKKIKDHLNDHETSDIKFEVGKKFIYAHLCILKARCKELINSFDDNGTIDVDGKRVIEIRGYSYDLYAAFIRYLYTDEPGENLSVDTIAGLYELSMKYDQENLKRISIKMFIGEIWVDSLAQCYKIAKEIKNKVLLDACKVFAKNNRIEL